MAFWDRSLRVNSNCLVVLCVSSEPTNLPTSGIYKQAGGWGLTLFYSLQGNTSRLNN